MTVIASQAKNIHLQVFNIKGKKTLSAQTSQPQYSM